MKKSILLVLCLVLVGSSALAGTMPITLKQLTNSVSLVYAQPDGVSAIDAANVGDMKVLTYTMEDPSMPVYVLTVSHSDLLNERDITDLEDTELAQLVEYTAFDSETHHYEVIEMQDGWPAVLIQYDGESESDWVDAFTLISGYLVQMHGYHTDFRTLTEEEDQMAFTLLDSINIVETEPAEDSGFVGMPNPMQEATAQDFAAIAGFEPVLPADATDVAYFLYTLGDTLAEVQFTSGDAAYTFRTENGKIADISGMYFSFQSEETASINGIASTIRFNEGNEGVYAWYDAAASINYSLSVNQGATAEGLQAMAEQLTAQ